MILSQQWVLIADSTKVMSSFFHSCLALGPIHVFEKKMDDAQTQIWVLLHTHKVCIIRHKNCVWAAPRCVWAIPDTSWLGNWAVREKRSRQYPLYYLQY